MFIYQVSLARTLPRVCASSAVFCHHWRVPARAAPSLRGAEPARCAVDLVEAVLRSRSQAVTLTHGLFQPYVNSSGVAKERELELSPTVWCAVEAHRLPEQSRIHHAFSPHRRSCFSVRGSLLCLRCRRSVPSEPRAALLSPTPSACSLSSADMINKAFHDPNEVPLEGSNLLRYHVKMYQCDYIFCQRTARARSVSVSLRVYCYITPDTMSQSATLPQRPQNSKSHLPVYAGPALPLSLSTITHSDVSRTCILTA